MTDIHNLSEDELRDLVYDDAILEEWSESGRWNEIVSTIVKTDDDEFYRVIWSRGLTEMQDDDFDSVTITPVVPVEKTYADTKTVYLDDDEMKKFQEDQKNKILSKDDLDSLNLLMDESDLDELLKNFEAVPTDDILKSLDSINGLFVTKEAKSYFHVTREFFEKLKKIQKNI